MVPPALASGGETDLAVPDQALVGLALHQGALLDDAFRVLDGGDGDRGGVVEVALLEAVGAGGGDDLVPVRRGGELVGEMDLGTVAEGEVGEVLGVVGGVERLVVDDVLLAAGGSGLVDDLGEGAVSGVVDGHPLEFHGQRGARAVDNLLQGPVALGEQGVVHPPVLVVPEVVEVLLPQAPVQAELGDHLEGVDGGAVEREVVGEDRVDADEQEPVAVAGGVGVGRGGDVGGGHAGTPGDGVGSVRVSVRASAGAEPAVWRRRQKVCRGHRCSRA